MRTIRFTVLPLVLATGLAAVPGPAAAQAPRQDCGPAPAGWYHPVPRSIQSLVVKPSPKAEAGPQGQQAATGLTPAMHLCVLPQRDPKAPRGVTGPTRRG